jgi:hypothetical protein
MYEPKYGPSSAPADFVVANNATFNDAMQFDPPPWGLTGATGCTGPNWNMIGMNFRMDVKRTIDPFSAPPLVSFNSTGSTGVTGGQIVCADVNQRIIYFNVPETVIQATLIPGEYRFDLIMYDGSSPPIRTPLCHGKFVVKDGVTGG